jgi:hypothetical protein
MSFDGKRLGEFDESKCKQGPRRPAGLSNNEIAARLFVSEATIKTHINRIFAKTASRDRGQAIAYAHRHRLTS